MSTSRLPLLAVAILGTVAVVARLSAGAPPASRLWRSRRPDRVARWTSPSPPGLSFADDSSSAFPIRGMELADGRIASAKSD